MLYHIFCMNMYVHVCVCVCVCTYKNRHKNTCMYLHTHTRTSIYSSLVFYFHVFYFSTNQVITVKQIFLHVSAILVLDPVRVLSYQRVAIHVSVPHLQLDLLYRCRVKPLLVLTVESVLKLTAAMYVSVFHPLLVRYIYTVNAALFRVESVSSRLNLLTA